MTSQDDILTISDVAHLLKVAEKTVYGLVQKGDLPAFKVGGQWRFLRTAIDSWIEVKTRAAGANRPMTKRNGRAQPGGPSER